MPLIYNINAPKKPTNLTVNTDLLNQAKDLNLNISSILEAALTDVVKQKKKKNGLKKTMRPSKFIMIRFQNPAFSVMT